METQESGPKSFKRVRSAVGRARTGVSGAIGHAPEVAGKARQRAAEVAERLPGALVSRFADSSGLANGLGQDLVGGLDPGEWR
jgi:hypothetical protein